MRKYKKLIAVVLVLSVALSFACAFSLVGHSGHRYCAECGCCTCSNIRAAGTILGSLGRIQGFGFVCFAVLCFFFSWAGVWGARRLSLRTPVELKVKLRN